MTKLIRRSDALRTLETLVSLVQKGITQRKLAAVVRGISFRGATVKLGTDHREAIWARYSKRATPKPAKRLLKGVALATFAQEPLFVGQGRVVGLGFAPHQLEMFPAVENYSGQGDFGSENRADQVDQKEKNILKESGDEPVQPPPGR